MTKRPLSVTILALYLMLVFGITLIGNLVSAARGFEPYSSTEWLLVAIPSLLAFAAGIALWRMLRVGAWLLFAGIVLGWALAAILRTGFFPNLTIASAVSLLIVAASVWILAKNWQLLRPLSSMRASRPEAAE